MKCAVSFVTKRSLCFSVTQFSLTGLTALSQFVGLEKFHECLVWLKSTSNTSRALKKATCAATRLFTGRMIQTQCGGTSWSFFQAPPGAAEANGHPRGEQLCANRRSQRNRKNNGEGLQMALWVKKPVKMMNCVGVVFKSLEGCNVCLMSTAGKMCVEGSAGG